MSTSLVGSVLVVGPELACSGLFGFEKVDGMDLQSHGLFFSFLGVLVMVDRHVEMDQRFWFGRRRGFRSDFGFEVWVGHWRAWFVVVGSWFVVVVVGSVVMVGFLVGCWRGA